MKDQPETPGKQKNPKSYLVVWVFTVLLLGGLAAVFSARPIVNAYQAWTAGRLVERAELEIDRGGLHAGYQHAWKAFELAPEDPRVLRLMGSLLMTVPTELDRAIYFYQRLKDKGDATIDDEVALVRCHLMNNRVEEAEKLLMELADKWPDDPSVLHVQADVEEHYGRSRRAAELLTEAFELETVPDKRLDLAVAMLKQGDGPMVEGAIDAIGDLAQRTDATGLRALEGRVFLVGEGRLGVEEIPGLAEKLIEHPESADQHLLMLESLRIMQNPEEKVEIVKAAIRERIGRPIHQLVKFFEWLVAEDEAEWVLDLVTKELAIRHPEVLEVYLSALIEERRWKDLDKILSQPDIPLGNFRKRLLRVKSGMVTGKDKGEVLREAYTALRLAQGSGSMSAVIEATAVAERMGDDDLFDYGLSILEGSSVLREGVLKGRFKMAKKNHDYERMRVATEKILRLSPDNEDYQEISLYLDLLLGVRLELVSFQVQEFVRQGKSGPMKEFLLAFDAFRRGDNQKASLLARQIDPWEIDQGPRAVLSAILDLGGDARRAAEIARQIPADMVLVPERRFLEAAMAQ